MKKHTCSLQSQLCEVQAVDDFQRLFLDNIGVSEGSCNAATSLGSSPRLGVRIEFCGIIVPYHASCSKFCSCFLLALAQPWPRSGRSQKIRRPTSPSSCQLCDFLCSSWVAVQTFWKRGFMIPFPLNHWLM